MLKKILNKFKKKPEVKNTTSQEDQLKNLRDYLGSSMDYVDIVLPMTYSEVENYFGPQCEDYEPLCACCCAWIEWQKTKKVTVSINREKIIELLEI